MSADPNSPEAFFAAAQDLARRRGLLANQQACIDQCRFTAVSYVLNDTSGGFIARVPLAEVRRIALARHQQLLQLEGIREVAEISRMRQIDRRRAFRKQPDRIRALAWALSDGRRVPAGAFTKRDRLIGLLLLLAGILPGVIYLLLALRRHRQYEHDLEMLLMRWRDRQRPDPSDTWFKTLGS